MSQTLQICSSGLNRPKNENEKNERKTKQAEKLNFLALGDLVMSSNKVFIKSQRLFFANRKKT